MKELFASARPATSVACAKPELNLVNKALLTCAIPPSSNASSFTLEPTPYLLTAISTEIGSKLLAVAMILLPSPTTAASV